MPPLISNYNVQGDELRGAHGFYEVNLNEVVGIREFVGQDSTHPVKVYIAYDSSLWIT